MSDLINSLWLESSSKYKWKVYNGTSLQGNRYDPGLHARAYNPTYPTNVDLDFKYDKKQEDFERRYILLNMAQANIVDKNAMLYMLKEKEESSSFITEKLPLSKKLEVILKCTT